MLAIFVAVAKVCVLFLKHGTLDRPQTFVVVLALRNCFFRQLGLAVRAYILWYSRIGFSKVHACAETVGTNLGKKDNYSKKHQRNEDFGTNYLSKTWRYGEQKLGASSVSHRNLSINDHWFLEDAFDQPGARTSSKLDTCANVTGICGVHV